MFESISDKRHDSDLPILAITQDYGAVPRDLIEYQISVTKKSIGNYKVVQIGDFIISLRSFQGGIEYSNYYGICSPAYVVLRNKLDLDKIFFKFYFKANNFIQQLNKKLEGIRDGKMISYTYFSDINLPLPSKMEQIRISGCISTIDKKLNIERSVLRQYQTEKMYLLQNLFLKSKE